MIKLLIALLLLAIIGILEAIWFAIVFLSKVVARIVVIAIMPIDWNIRRRCRMLEFIACAMEEEDEYIIEACYVYDNKTLHTIVLALYHGEDVVILYDLYIRLSSIKIAARRG